MSLLDLLLSPTSLRQFSSAISCLSKVGKELLVCSDSTGVYLSVLSDAKSSYLTVKFGSDFFLSCNPLMEVGGKGEEEAKERGGRRREKRRREREERRKREREEGRDRRKKKNKKAKKKRKHDSDDISSSDSGFGSSSNSSSHASDSDSDPDDTFLCRLPVKNVHNILRRPRDVTNVRITAEGTEEDEELKGGKVMQMVFEFTSPSCVKVVHKSVCASSERTTVVAPIGNSSIMKCRVADLNRLVEHIKKSQEIAMTFTPEAVKVSSFNQESTMPLGMSEPGKSHGGGMKTEATMEKDEMTSYLFKDNRNEDDEANDGMPDNANEEVKLVFSLKEVKAIIDFGKGPSGGQGNNWGGQYSQKNPGAWAANPEDDYLVRGENPVSVFYEWGGKPVTFRVEGKEDEEGGGSEWAAELISATLVDQLNETVNGVD